MQLNFIRMMFMFIRCHFYNYYEDASIFFFAFIPHVSVQSLYNRSQNILSTEFQPCFTIQRLSDARFTTLEVSFVQYKNIAILFKMDELHESNDEDIIFDLDEIVWAKITGYPWWPAKITIKPNEEGTHYRVDFLGDNSHAFVGQSKITKYDQMRSEYDIHKHLQKGLRKAIVAADHAIQQLRTVTCSSRLAVMQVEVCGGNQKQLLQSPLIEQTLLQEKFEQLPNQQNQHKHPQQIQQQNRQSQQQNMNPTQLYSKQQRIRYVNSLLNKYQLHFMPKITHPGYHSKQLDHKSINRIAKKRNMPLHKGIVLKYKKKINKQIKETPMHYLLARKINQLLKRKNELKQEQRQTISIILSNEILGQAGSHEDLIRLFKWINISPYDTIANFYDNWTCLQSEKQKSSNMTVQEL